MPDQISDIIRKVIGQRIRHYREESRLTLRDLEVISGVGHSWIAKVEKGQINLQIDSLIKLLAALEIQPRELFDFELPYK